MLAADYEAATTKGEKSKVITAFFLDPAKTSIYRTVSTTMSSERLLTKTEKWITQKDIDLKWTELEIAAHLKSGRLITREDPMTAGVWEYQDSADISMHRHVSKKKAESGNQDSVVAPEDVDEWKSLFDSCVLGLTNSAFEIGQYAWNESGSTGKGSSLATVKGKGKGKNTQPTPSPPADPDPENTASTKAKQCIGLLDKKMLALEEDQHVVKRTFYYTPALKKQYAMLANKLDETKTKLKKALLGEQFKGTKLEPFKVMLANAVMVVKEGTDFIREHKGFSDKMSQVGEDY